MEILEFCHTILNRNLVISKFSITIWMFVSFPLWAFEFEMWNDCHALGVDFGAWHMDSGTYDALENAYYGDEGSKHVLERRIPILLSWISATASRLLYIQSFEETRLKFWRFMKMHAIVLLLYLVKSVFGRIAEHYCMHEAETTKRIIKK